ncbi:MAG: ferrochelatase [Alphaproteobacteria bacterium]|nr:ferrochelatase [Alphaproteobacteria bacterium]
MAGNVPVHPEIPTGRTGVLLINLGTPAAPDVRSIRRFLAEFLSDRRVIELNPLLWQPVLRLVILKLRPARLVETYRGIWDAETGESPLRVHSREQAVRLGERMDLAGRRIEVAWAVRYGSPSIEDGIAELTAKGCRNILLFALYPQYSATTTASAYDAAFRVLQRMRWQPAVRTAGPYHDDPAYIDALAASLQEHVGALDWVPDRYLVSFHGLPRRYFDAGDPYHCHCAKTTRLLAERLGWPADRYSFAFQSRFGREEWLRPYMNEVLDALPADGYRRVVVISPGFAADCVETLSEVAIEFRQAFLEAGGLEFSYVPCLNAEPRAIDMLETLVQREVSGWPG